MRSYKIGQLDLRWVLCISTIFFLKRFMSNLQKLILACSNHLSTLLFIYFFCFSIFKFDFFNTKKLMNRFSNPFFFWVLNLGNHRVPCLCTGICAAARIEQDKAYSVRARPSEGTIPGCLPSFPCSFFFSFLNFLKLK